MDALLQATAGAIGSVFSLSLLYPLDLAKKRLQAQRKRGVSSNTGSKADGDVYKGVVDVLKKVQKKNGFLGIYAGLSVALTRAAIVNFIFDT